MFTSGIYACGPNRFGGTCNCFFCFVEGPTRARYLESDDFARAAMLREKNIEHQADDELNIHIYAAAHAASLSKSETKKREFRLIKAEIGGFPCDIPYGWRSPIAYMYVCRCTCTTYCRCLSSLPFPHSRQNFRFSVCATRIKMAL